MTTNTSSLKTSAEWLKSAQARLKAAGIESYLLDPLIFLENRLGISRTKLLASDEHLTETQLKNLGADLTRRLSHEPVAYINQQIEFYGRAFFVQPGVFIPRIESEAFIEIIKRLDLPQKPKIVDLGTGSGCLGITTKLELPDALVELIDISDIALKTARQNSAKHHAEVQLDHSDHIEPNRSYDLVIANLPYVPTGLKTNLDLSFEPPRAIFAGQDGLDAYRDLFVRIKELNRPPKFILVESLLNQQSSLNELAKQASYKLVDDLDMVQAYEKLTTN